MAGAAGFEPATNSQVKLSGQKYGHQDNMAQAAERKIFTVSYKYALVILLYNQSVSMELPIASLLKRRNELETAQLEDDVVDILANMTDKLALHGGTAVWRCYGGKRFSKDVDAYIWEGKFKEKFMFAAEKLGVEVLKFREKRLTYMHVRKGDTEIKIEPNNAEKASILAPYERVDGSKRNVLVLSPEDLIMEKINTYKDRRAYKDLYDITVLLNHVKYPYKIKAHLSKFAENIPEPDEALQSYSEFRAVIYAGVSPSYGKMSEFVRRWIS